VKRKGLIFPKQELNKSGIDIEKHINQRSAVVKYFVSSVNAVNGSSGIMCSVNFSIIQYAH
jgi:hypothetical protein